MTSHPYCLVCLVPVILPLAESWTRIRSGPRAYGQRGFVTNELFTWIRLGFLTFKIEEQTASEDAGQGLEDNVLEWKVLRRCELFRFQCLSALLSVSIMTLENPATCPACLGFHLLRGPCLPLLFIQNFNSIRSPVPPALSPGFTVFLLSNAFFMRAQIRIIPPCFSPPFMPLP